MPPETQITPEKTKWNFWETDPKRNFSPWFLTFCTILVMVGLGMAGYYKYQAFQIYKSIKATQAQSQAEFEALKEKRVQGVVELVPTAQAWTKEINTSGWKTYTNKEYGFEIKYPTTYTPLEPDHTTDEVGYWDHVVVLFGCTDKFCLDNSLSIMIIDDTSRLSKEPYLGKKVGERYLVLSNSKDEEVIDQVISTFRSTN